VLAPTARLGWEIVDLKFDLEDVLGRPVDLVPKSGLKWLIRDRVLAEARVLYAVKSEFPLVAEQLGRDTWPT
jgi:predicted nucleotidyltransferase